MVNQHARLGRIFEEKACAFLKDNQLKLVTQNYRCKLGEIDLIMQDQDEYVFVEVRARGNSDFGTALESVSPHKQRKIVRAATQYLLEKDSYEKVNCRFDIIGISPNSIEWIKNAFSVDEI